VRQAFVVQDPAYSQHFQPGVAGKWMADLSALAASKLQALGVNDITYSGCCTFTQSDRFYSYRRDQVTGRMATMIWIDR
jgi:copper oxidase (laccase) domain-containing protein